MSCEIVQNALKAYASGELPCNARRNVEQHIQACPACRTVLAEIDDLAAVLSCSENPPVPSGFSSRVMTLARSNNSCSDVEIWGPLLRWHMMSFPVRLAAAAMLVIGLSLGGLMGWSTLPDIGDTQNAAGAVEEPRTAIAQINLDYFNDAPKSSLAESYLALLSGQDNGGL
jgi:anti-sigma factor RsiW